jgi:hypothetical protein
MSIHLFYFHLIDHHWFGKNFFSGENCVITQLFLCCGWFGCRKRRWSIF